jgi:cold shock CspA family protein
LSGPVPSHRPYFGRVTSFDPRRGLGTVTDSDGVEYDFHATAILNGSRHIDPGTDVTFIVRPGHRGRYEAGALTELEDTGPTHQLPS